MMNTQAPFIILLQLISKDKLHTMKMVSKNLSLHQAKNSQLHLVLKKILPHQSLSHPQKVVNQVYQVIPKYYLHKEASQKEVNLYLKVVKMHPNKSHSQHL